MASLEPPSRSQGFDPPRGAALLIVDLPEELLLRALQAVSLRRPEALAACLLVCRPWRTLGREGQSRAVARTGPGSSADAEEVLARLSALPSLTQVDVARTCANGSFIAALPRAVPRLQHLEVEGGTFDEAALEALFSQSRSLISLNLRDDSARNSPVVIPHALSLVTGLTRLELFWCGPCEDPLGTVMGGNILLAESVSALSRLQSLSFRSQFMPSLPPSLGALTALTALCIANDRARQVPPELGLLHGLRVLCLHACAVTCLPEALGGLAALRSLDLDCSALEELPQGFGRLLELRRLRVQSMRLRELPATLGALPKLEAVSVEAAQLTSIALFPSALASLDLAHCWKFQAPRCMGLSGLRWLRLGNNWGLQALCWEAPSLTRLELRLCVRLHSLPCFAALPHLQSLALVELPSLQRLPACLASLRALRDLRLQGCPGVQRLPCLRSLSSLARLSLRQCQDLASLPACLSALRSLTAMHIVCCPSLHALPCLGPLPLRELRLGECPNLQELPTCVSRVTSLDAIEVRRCRSLKDPLPLLSGLGALRECLLPTPRHAMGKNEIS